MKTLPDPAVLINKLDLGNPLIGLYDAPAALSFAPIIEMKTGVRTCIFQHYRNWMSGRTLKITKNNYGCGGCGHWWWNLETRSRKEYVDFLADEEGLKVSHELMEAWLDQQKPYMPEHDALFLGPLKDEYYAYLKTITFFVNPDQLSVLITGATYFSMPGDPGGVQVNFGSGCMEMITLFPDIDKPLAIIGATDFAMRPYIPRDILAFTVTKPMFELLCSLDTKSFLFRPFLERLKKSRNDRLG
jgi:hypothetical protein